MNLVPSTHFIEELGKLEKRNVSLKRAVIKTLNQIRMNPSHPSLRLHKLSGQDTYSVSVTPSIRIIFTWRGDEAYLLRIGSHENVY
jgi:mRNA-degrading endonuclease YafQ of YafQ-DinJ toxin-antitoxin module